MTIQPTIPDAAVKAATRDVYERTACSEQMAERLARGAVSAALPHLLPGLYVAPGVYWTPAIWAEDSDRPGSPTEMLVRTEANARLFDAIAALLPDRTEEEDPS